MKNFAKYLRKALRHKFLKDGALPCESLLGSTAKVEAFGKFWENNGDDLMVVVADALNNYCSENNINSDQHAAFKAGQVSLGNFFLQCYMESDSKSANKKRD